MLQATLSPRQIPSCERTIFMKNLAAGTKFCPCDMSPEFKSVWIEGTCRGVKTTLHPGHTQGRPVWTVHATCPRDTSENKPIRKRNHDMSLRQDPPCEHFKTPIPATCPFVWTAHEILPRDMSLQHVPSCEPTLTRARGESYRSAVMFIKLLYARSCALCRQVGEGGGEGGGRMAPCTKTQESVPAGTRFSVVCFPRFGVQKKKCNGKTILVRLTDELTKKT